MSRNVLNRTRNKHCCAPLDFASYYLNCSFFGFAVDIISAIEFDKTGDHLATGDRGGRVVLFERTDKRDVCLFVVCLFLLRVCLLALHMIILALQTVSSCIKSVQRDADEV